MKWRILGLAVAAAALGWSAWWYVGASARDAAIADWMADRRAEGWQAEVAAIDTAGFPNRFDTTLRAPALADPAEGWAWSAPFLQLLTLSYQPNAVVAAFPPTQTIAVPGAAMTLQSERLRASLRLTPGLSLRLARASVVGEGLRADAGGWRATAARVETHLRAAARADAPADAYDAFFAFEALALPDGLRRRIDPAGRLPATAESLRIDAELALDRPLDRFALEQAPPQARAIVLRSAEARWGPLGLRATGTLRADAQGYAEGALDLTAENWRQMLRAAAQAGAISEDLARLVEGGLGFVAALSGDGETLSAPLSFSDGRARIGPVTLGRAPRLIRPAR